MSNEEENMNNPPTDIRKRNSFLWRGIPVAAASAVVLIAGLIVGQVAGGAESTQPVTPTISATPSPTSSKTPTPTPTPTPTSNASSTPADESDSGYVEQPATNDGGWQADTGYSGTENWQPQPIPDPPEPAPNPNTNWQIPDIPEPERPWCESIEAVGAPYEVDGVMGDMWSDGIWRPWGTTITC